MQSRRHPTSFIEIHPSSVHHHRQHHRHHHQSLHADLFVCVCTCACLRSSCLIQPLSLCAPPFHILRANPTPLSPRPTSACPSLPVGPAPLHLPLSACWQCIPPATRDRSWRVHVTISPLFANHALGHGAKSSSGAAPSHTFFCFSLFVSWVSIPCLCFGVFFPELRFLDFVCSWVLFS